MLENAMKPKWLKTLLVWHCVKNKMVDICLDVFLGQRWSSPMMSHEDVPWSIGRCHTSLVLSFEQSLVHFLRLLQATLDSHLLWLCCTCLYVFGEVFCIWVMMSICNPTFCLCCFVSWLEWHSLWMLPNVAVVSGWRNKISVSVSVSVSIVLICMYVCMYASSSSVYAHRFTSYVMRGLLLRHHGICAHSLPSSIYMQKHAKETNSHVHITSSRHMRSMCVVSVWRLCTCTNAHIICCTWVCALAK